MAPLTPSIDLGNLSAASPVAEMRAFIDKHDLGVAKNVGGRGRRTKADIFEDIKAAAGRVRMDVVDPNEFFVPPPPVREFTPDELTLKLANKSSPVGLKDHLEYCIKKLGKSQRPAEAMAALLTSKFSGERLNAKPNDFMIEQPSAKGLAHMLGLTTRELCLRMSVERAIEEEIARHGTAEDCECLHYVLHQKAGESSREFPNGVRDETRQQETFDDFCQMEEAQRAGLEREEVLALRLYTTAIFKSLNNPLRAGTKPHPMPATIGFLHSGIKKLRENGKDKPGTKDFFRGMRDMLVGFDSRFMELAEPEDPGSHRGGVECAPMSTTSDFKVAVQYGASRSSLIFKVATDGFRQRGADISFLSAFPGEKEFVYPPGTFLAPTGKQEEIDYHGAKFTVIEVKPDID